MCSITALQNVLFTKDRSFNDYCTIYLSIGCDRDTSRSVRTLVGRRWGNHGARIRNIKFYISAVTSRYLRQQWSTISAAAADSQQTLDLDVSVKTSGCLFVSVCLSLKGLSTGDNISPPLESLFAVLILAIISQRDVCFLWRKFDKSDRSVTVRGRGGESVDCRGIKNKLAVYNVAVSVNTGNRRGIRTLLSCATVCLLFHWHLLLPW